MCIRDRYKSADGLSLGGECSKKSRAWTLAVTLNTDMSPVGCCGNSSGVDEQNGSLSPPTLGWYCQLQAARQELCACRCGRILMHFSMDTSCDRRSTFELIVVLTVRGSYWGATQYICNPTSFSCLFSFCTHDTLPMVDDIVHVGVLTFSLKIRFLWVRYRPPFDVSLLTI